MAAQARALPAKTERLPRPDATAKSSSLGGGSLPSARANWREFALPMAVLGIIMAMIAPLPPFLLDILISANITLSVIVLLVSLYITKPVDFSVFPTTLLLMTLFRLALNI
jgi:flagellar biosynthesis protein FlhA